MLIVEIAQFIISEDSVKKMEEAVNNLFRVLSRRFSFHHESDQIAKNLYDVLYKLYGFSIGDPIEIKEEVFAQAVLVTLFSCVYYESIRYSHKLDSLDNMSQMKILIPTLKYGRLEKACCSYTYLI